MINSENNCTENEGSCMNCRFINNYPDCYYKAEDEFYDGFEPGDGICDETDHEAMIMRALRNGEGEKLGY